MYDITKTRMLLTTVVFAAAAALFAAGANARIPEEEETSSAGAAQESLRLDPYAAQAPSWWGKGGKGEETDYYRGEASIGGVDAVQAQSGQGEGGTGEDRTAVTAPAFPSGGQLDSAIGAAMASQTAVTAPAFPSGGLLDSAIGAAMASQTAVTAPAFPSGGQLDTAIGTAKPWGGQVSLGLTGDSALTRVNQPVEARGQATSLGNGTDWTSIGVGAGMAALLAAALAGLYLTARHRNRVALP